jgi:hypothetical protein
VRLRGWAGGDRLGVFALPLPEKVQGGPEYISRKSAGCARRPPQARTSDGLLVGGQELDNGDLRLTLKADGDLGDDAESSLGR